MEKDKRKYFSHDFNARHDKKMAVLIKDFKGTGYAVYWAVVEMIHEEGGQIEFDEINIGAIAKDLYEEPTLVKLIIEGCCSKFKLFKLEEGIITSDRATRNIENYTELVSNKRQAGIASAESRRKAKDALKNLEQNSTGVQQPLTGVEQKATNRNINRNRNRKNVSIVFPDGDKKDQKNDDSGKNGSDRILTGAGKIDDVVCYDAEEMILKDQAFLEVCCMKEHITMEEAKVELHKYHLNESKNNKYPMGNKSARAGYELWLIRSKEFKPRNNGKNKNSGVEQNAIGSSITFDQP